MLEGPHHKLVRAVRDGGRVPGEVATARQHAAAIDLELIPIDVRTQCNARDHCFATNGLAIAG